MMVVGSKGGFGGWRTGYLVGYQKGGLSVAPTRRGGGKVNQEGQKGEASLFYEFRNLVKNFLLLSLGEVHTTPQNRGTVARNA